MAAHHHQQRSCCQSEERLHRLRDADNARPPAFQDEPSDAIPDPRERAGSVKQFLDLVDAQIVSKLRRVNWLPKDGAFPVIVAAAVTRQHDGLRAIAELVLSDL